MVPIYSAVMDKLPDGYKLADVFFKRNKSTGRIQAFCKDTGTLLAEELPNTMHKLELTEVENKLIKENPVMLKQRLQYHHAFCDIIPDLLRSGQTITKICEMEGMPTYSTYCKWKRTYPGFKVAVEEAMEDKAQSTIDKIMDDIIDGTITDDTEIKSLTLKLKAMQYIAGKLDPNKYGDGKSSAGPGNVQIIVNTGINREPVTIEGEKNEQISGRERQLRINEGSTEVRIQAGERQEAEGQESEEEA